MKVRITYASERSEYTEIISERELIDGNELEPDEYRPLEFNLNDIEQYRGNHYIYVSFESLGQSDTWIPWLWDDKSKNVTVSVTHVLDRYDTQRFSCTEPNLSNTPHS